MITPSDPQGGPLVMVIGCTADGVDSLLQLCAAEAGPHVSPDGSVWVVVPQGGGDRTLCELLDRHTAREVALVSEPRPLAGGLLLVAPSDRRLAVRDEHVEPGDPAELDARTAPSPIDDAMQRLAAAVGARTVGIVLAGRGSDGATGLRAIGEAGGMTMAEKGETVRAHDLPAAAERVGPVDHVLSPIDMVAELTAYERHVRACRPSTVEPLDEAALRDAIPLIAERLQARAGHDFRHYRPNTLVRRIRRRMQVLRIAEVDVYLQRLRDDEEEARALFRELLIGVTRFFRDAAAFQALRTQVLPGLIDRIGPEGSLRLWVPGCATGEEAYSLGMLVLEALEDRGVRAQVQIFATDIDERALATARSGTYPIGIVEEVSEERLARFFVRRGAHYQVRPELREVCLYSAHNLIADPPFSRIDLVSCRNLLIYLGQHLQEKLVPMFHFALRSGGYLFLGNSENLGSHPELFRAISKRHRILQRRAVARGPAFTNERRDAADPPPDRPPPAPDLTAIAQRIVVDEFSPQWAIVDDAGQVQELSAGAARYLALPAGSFRNDVVQLARDGLRAGLRAALRDARARRRKVVHDGLVLRTADAVQRVSLTVQPMPALGNDEELLMLVFQRIGAELHADEAEGAAEAACDSEPKAVVRQLEQELAVTRQDLERTVQELEAANEELKASNEELLSMNEELQSANEELETSKEAVQAGAEALSLINDDLENLLRSSEVATLFVDDELRILRYTPAVADVYNVLPGDVGRPLGHLTHLAREMPAMPDAARVVAASARDELQLGDGRWLERRVLPYRDADGSRRGLVITFADITPAKSAERFLRRTLDSLYTFAGLMTTDGVLVEANRSALAVAGVEREDVIGLPLEDTPWFGWSQEERARVREAIEAARAGKGSRYDAVIRLAGGDHTTVDFQLVPMFDDDGTVTHLIPSAIDIGDRKRFEAALEANEERLERLLEELEGVYANAPVGLCVLDRELRYVRVNAALAEINGVPAETHIGRTVAEVLPEVADAVVPVFREVLRTGTPVYGVETEGETPAQPGVRRHWLASYLPMTNRDGEVTGINLVAEEITDRKRQERSLQRARAQAERARGDAERASASKSDFLANMSHEIRTPMTAMLGYAELLSGYLEDPDNLACVQTIRKNGELLLELVNDILDLSRIEAGKLDVQNRPYSPAELAHDAFELLRLRAFEKGLQAKLELDEQLPAELLGDPIRIRQVLVNLLGNAVKFTEQGSVVLRVSFEAGDGGGDEKVRPRIRFLVTDTGIGMTEAQSRNVFDAFTQADGSITRRFGGSGLGLSISQRLAEHMGGRLELATRLHVGSTFTLDLAAEAVGELRLVRPPATRPLPQAASPATVRLVGTLLVVDDRPDIRHVVQHMLEAAGAEVLTAADGVQALRRLQEGIGRGERIDAVVLDMRMPVMDGYETARRLRADGFDRPIVALTADAMVGERERCLAAGCDAYLTKPIDSARMLETLHRCLRGEAPFDASEAAPDTSASEAPRASNGAAEPQVADRVGDAGRVLVVDDHLDTCRALITVLERTGYVARSAPTVSDALSVAQDFRPHVVVTDIGLPDGDGYELVRALRRPDALPDAAFVALSGSEEPDASRAGLFDHWLVKPASLKAVLEKVRAGRAAPDAPESAPAA